MKVPSFIFLVILLFSYGFSRPEIPIGYQVTLAVPLEYDAGFIGRAFLIENDQMVPNFRAALTVEAVNGRYSCSLEGFLGDVRVWSSGHYSRVYASNKCLLELTRDGDLTLKGSKERIGWKTGTSGQGVERLEMQNTGNLVLLDALNRTKWQSFNFPTDVMLRGQRLNVATRLTSFPSNSSFFYSFEIENKRVALYLNAGNYFRYSYWEFKPTNNRSITFVKLGSRGLGLFSEKYKKIAQIASSGIHPLRFLALKNETGNLGLYFYSPETEKFQTSFRALNSTCDLPMACQPYGICTSSNACSCVRLLVKANDQGSSNCSGGISGNLCDRKEAEMLELEGITSVLNGTPKLVNVSKEVCVNMCLDNCKCSAALYYSSKETRELNECYLYKLVMGLKQVGKGSGLSYMVKVPKGAGGNNGQSSVKKWVLILVAVGDGVIVLVVLAVIMYCLMRKKRRNSRRQPDASTNSS